MTSRTLRRWKPDELAILHRLLQEGETHAQIAAALNTSVQRVKARVCWEGKDDLARQRRREQIQAARHRRSGAIYSRDYVPSTPRGLGAYATVASRPSPELLAERDRRMAAPRTIGAAQFGDPPPGYSALDRKRQGMDA